MVLSRVLGIVGLLLGSCSAYTSALATLRRSAVRTCSVRSIEPITTTTAAAFAAGLLPPSLLLGIKEGEVQNAKSEAAAAQSELARLREGFTSLIETLEVEVDLADTELDELLAAGSRAAKQRKEELKLLREKYEKQIKQLKDLIGDYTDSLELQQNSYKRLSAIADSARSESLALKERARLLEERLNAANAQLAKVQAEADATPLDNFMKMFK